MANCVSRRGALTPAIMRRYLPMLPLVSGHALVTVHGHRCTSFLRVLPRNLAVPHDLAMYPTGTILVYPPIESLVATTRCVKSFLRVER